MTAGMTFFLSSGLPLLTEARNISPTEPLGSLLSLDEIIVTAMMYKFLAPVLSAQFITHKVGKQDETLRLRRVLPIQLRRDYFLCVLYMLQPNSQGMLTLCPSTTPFDLALGPD